MAAMNGTIKRLVSDKGFGFVAAEDGSEYFFHQSACAQFDTLREGQQVIALSLAHRPPQGARRRRGQLAHSAQAQAGKHRGRLGAYAPQRAYRQRMQEPLDTGVGDNQQAIGLARLAGAVGRRDRARERRLVAERAGRIDGTEQ